MPVIQTVWSLARNADRLNQLILTQETESSPQSLETHQLSNTQSERPSSVCEITFQTFSTRFIKENDFFKW